LLAEIVKDMNHLRITLLSISLLIPLSAFAHGEEVLMTLLIQAVSVIFFLIIIFALKIDLRRKIILTGAYFLSVLAIDYMIRNWPYRENMNKINLLVAIIPPTIALITFLALKIRS
jgi:hypothetical protein